MAAFADHIGDRLDHPERVPAEFQHLIADDQQRVMRILEFPVTGYVLDVGCSDGAILKRIERRWGPRGAKVLGADLAVHPHLPNRLAWDIRTPFPATMNFAAIFACEVLEHLTPADVEIAMGHLCEILTPAGQLLVTVPNRHPADLYEVGCRSRWAWPDHRSAWTTGSLRRMLRRRFRRVTLVPLYDHERPEDSIWLIAHASKKR